MRQVIYKYQLSPYSVITELTMPTYATILSIQAQHDQPVLWALVNPGNEAETRRILGVVTGTHFEPSGTKYLATVQIGGGDYVVHYFECLSEGDKP